MLQLTDKTIVFRFWNRSTSTATSLPVLTLTFAGTASFYRLKSTGNSRVLQKRGRQGMAGTTLRAVKKWNIRHSAILKLTLLFQTPIKLHSAALLSAAGNELSSEWNLIKASSGEPKASVKACHSPGTSEVRFVWDRQHPPGTSGRRLTGHDTQARAFPHGQLPACAWEERSPHTSPRNATTAASKPLPTRSGAGWRSREPRPPRDGGGALRRWLPTADACRQHSSARRRHQRLRRHAHPLPASALTFSDGSAATAAAQGPRAAPRDRANHSAAREVALRVCLLYVCAGRWLGGLWYRRERSDNAEQPGLVGPDHTEPIDSRAVLCPGAEVFTRERGSASCWLYMHCRLYVHCRQGGRTVLRVIQVCEDRGCLRVVSALLS